ncbi:hypothetical protein BASA61_001845 [Batrachochytrium salamandrivorans]|nr:hypothetical protein BASA61_001845 [Batrachochytrium salamandrivorans]
MSLILLVDISLLAMQSAALLLTGLTMMILFAFEGNGDATQCLTFKHYEYSPWTYYLHFLKNATVLRHAGGYLLHIYKLPSATVAICTRRKLIIVLRQILDQRSRLPQPTELSTMDRVMHYTPRGMVAVRKWTAPLAGSRFIALRAAVGAR